MTVPAPISADPADLAASIIDWWAQAGVDMALADSPRNWLAAQSVKAVPVTAPVAEARMEAAAVKPPRAPAAPMPEELGAFLRWLADDPDQPEAAFAEDRILPDIGTDLRVLILTDIPTQADMQAGKLFAGDDGDLLTAMLRAIGMRDEDSGRASLLMARPAGGIIDDGTMDMVIPRLVKLIQLTAPQIILLLGDRTDRAFRETKLVTASSFTSDVNLKHGKVSVVSLPAPFVLLKHPGRKAAAWGQLRHLAAH